MDWQLVVAINVMVISVAVALSALRLRMPGYGTIVAVHAIVIGAGLAAWWYAPAYLLPAVAVPFILLFAVPALLSTIAHRASLRGDEATVARFSRYAMWWQPTRASTFAYDLAQATRHHDEAEADAALAALAVRATRDDERAIVRAFQAARRHDWRDAVDAMDSLPAPTLMVAPLRIRAFGELGRLDDMIAAYESIKTRLTGQYQTESLRFLFTFAGRPDLVERLQKSSPARQPLEFDRYWIARARRRAARDDTAANAVLEQLATSARQSRVRAAATHALTDTTQPHMNPQSRVQFDAAAARFLAALSARAVPWHRSYATLGLVALNLIMFGVAAWQGGTEDPETLWRLGALWPPSITTDGEWWRLLTPAVLHFGPIHLALNTLMLLVFGRIVETRVGPALMVALYVACAVGSTATVYALMRAGVLPESFLVGASGAIFGLVGVMLAFDVAAWIRSRDRLDRSRVASLLALLGLQALVDFAIPNISFAGHASGLVIGFVLGGGIAWRRAPNRQLATS